MKSLVWQSFLGGVQLSLLIFGFFSPPGAEAGEDPALRAAAAFYDGIRTEVLPNGLHVYLKPIANFPVVTTMVAYKVGSADEDLSHTGLSHYLEHLMFKGTDKIMPGDIDRTTERFGGANNAYTAEDYTVYHFDFDARNWERALEIEADRMRNLRIDARHEFEKEKGAVIGELESDEDEPGDLENKALLPLLFGNGAYGHPVIGVREHVRNATAEVIKGYYDKWYHPNNASLVVCGGIDADRALVRIRELFGSIPKADLPARNEVVSIERAGPVHKDMESKFDVPRLFMGYNTVRGGEPDSYVLDVISNILAGGKTGRLYKKLVEDDQVANGVNCGTMGGRYPGWFLVQVELLKGKDLGKVEDAVLAEIKELATKPVSLEELNRVKRGVIAAAVFARESPHGLADSIARGVTTNDLDYVRGYLPKIDAVSVQDVERVAAKYLDAKLRVSLWSHPHRESGTAPAAPPASPQAHQRHRRDVEGAGGSFNLDKTERVVLPNGLTLLLLENHRLPIVVAEAFVRDVSMLEPENKIGIASLVGSLLDEGTPKHTGRQISELIENVGGALQFTSSGGSVKVLTPDRDLGIGLLLECLSQANFPQEAFSRQQAQQLSTIGDVERQPEYRARKVFRAAIYGSHPYGRPSLGSAATVQALTRADAEAFHRDVFLPNTTTIAIAGDFETKQVVDLVTRQTETWKKGAPAVVKGPEVSTPRQFEVKILTMDSAQLHFLMGHVGVRRSNPDFYKLLVMDYVLGTGPGFTDRISARLRDREGLGYTVNANITSSATNEPGLFVCYIGTAPHQYGRVKELFLEELNRIRDETPGQQEVDDAKSYLLGSLLFKFITLDRLANQLILIDHYHLGPHYIDKFRKAVSEVTPRDVQEVARKYIDPKHMILVAAGAIDGAGKPLAPPK
jgi:zinc protease